MDYVKPNENLQTYVIGIDFGHGETSADICNIQWNDNFLQLDHSPKSIEIFAGQVKIKSVLLIEQNDDQETYYIGQTAVSKYSNHRGHKGNSKFFFYAGFKKAPSIMTDTEKNVMRIFMKEVYQQIRRQRNELTDTNHLVYIACPSNPDRWDEKEKLRYAEIALEAGIPLANIDDKNIGIIRESRAAFIKARSNIDTRSSVKEGILLIDFGSSTVDLTYYSSKFTKKPIDDGYECGASNVEYLISEDMSKNISEVADAFTDNTAKTAIHLIVRDIKEGFYAYYDNSEEMEVELNLTKITKGRVQKSIDHYYPKEKIEEILSDYIESIRNAFIDYRDKHLSGKPIKLIFMTGGASRMNFIEKIAGEVFNCEKFYRERDPSLTISNGIALAGRADLRTYAMENELLVSNYIRNADIATITFEKTASAIACRVISDTERCYSSFASRSYDDNLNSLENSIKIEADSIYASSYLNSAYNDALRKVTNEDIIPKINNIVKEYFPDFEIESIKSSTSFSLSVKSDSINTLSTVISSSLSKIAEGFIEGLAKLLFNVVTGGFALAEGIAANIGIRVVNIFKDKPIKYVNIDEFVDDVTLSFRNKTTKLSSSQRATVNDEFQKNKDTYESSISTDVKHKLESDSSLVSQININGRNEIKKYICDQINKARIMLY